MSWLACLLLFDSVINNQTRAINCQIIGKFSNFEKIFIKQRDILLFRQWLRFVEQKDKYLSYLVKWRVLFPTDLVIQARIRRFHLHLPGCRAIFAESRRSSV